MIRIQDIRLVPGYTEDDLRRAVGQRLHVPFTQIREIRLRRRSVDARDKRRVTFLLTVDVRAEGEARILQKCTKDHKIAAVDDKPYRVPICHTADGARPVVVGFGPGGMFAAYVLAKAGLRPIVLERGRPVEQRMADVAAFRQTGVLLPESNVQFGEGGAGTFSDGKLATGIRDPRIRFVLETFAACGAPEEILWQAKPHIGTDRLTETVRTIRERIIQLGGDIRFGACMTGYRTENGHISSIVYTQDGQETVLPTRHAILALGHSARDTLEHLYAAGLPLAPKPFAMGVRIEHLQTDIDRAQYGSFAGHPALGAADYKLAVHLPNGRSLYTFCMCPGGEVVAASSEPERLAVNGMSCFARDGRNANSALLVGVTPADFGSDHPLAGMHWQRALEAAAYRAGGGAYRAPVIRVGDFLAHRVSTAFGRVTPTYTPGTVFASPDDYLPDFMCETLRQGIPLMDRRLHGFADPDAVLTGIESRSSSPVRMLRGDDYHSIGVPGLYPCGEGAGYAGGITSAAVDGIHCAEAVIQDLGGAVWKN